MKFIAIWDEFEKYFSKPKTLLKICGLAFLYLLIGMLAFYFVAFLYFIFPSEPNPFDFFFSTVFVAMLIWGFMFGYIPTCLSGVVLYFIIARSYRIKNISRIWAIFLGWLVGWGSITVITFLVLLVFSGRSFPTTFPIHYTFASVIASLIGVFAGTNVYNDVEKQFRDDSNE